MTHRAIIVMGVSGSGKSTVGRLLAERTGVPFLDADDLHPVENVEKMAAGIPLSDQDRSPWLRAIRSRISQSCERGESLVVACSALKAKYRSALYPESTPMDSPLNVHFVFLKGEFELIHRRLIEREGHFMGAEMLRSQFDTLQEPRDAVAVEIDRPVSDIVDLVMARLEIVPCRS